MKEKKKVVVIGGGTGSFSVLQGLKHYSDIAITAHHILKVKENLNRILAKNTGKSITQVEKDSDR